MENSSIKVLKSIEIANQNNSILNARSELKNKSLLDKAGIESKNNWINSYNKKAAPEKQALPDTELSAELFSDIEKVLYKLIDVDAAPEKNSTQQLLGLIVNMFVVEKESRSGEWEILILLKEELSPQTSVRLSLNEEELKVTFYCGLADVMMKMQSTILGLNKKLTTKFNKQIDVDVIFSETWEAFC